MIRNLPEGLEGLRSFLPELVAQAMSKVPYASVLVTQAGGEAVWKTKSEERVNPIPPDPGIRISVWDGATFHSIATNRLADRSHLVKLTRELRDSVTVKPGPTPDPGSRLDRHFQTESVEDPAAVTTQERQGLCNHAYRVMTEFDARIVSADARYAFEREYRLFCNPQRLLSAAITNVGFVLLAFAAEGSRQVANFRAFNGPGAETARVADAELRLSAENAVAHLAAARIEPGEYRVILDPDIAGTLAHESFGHGCEVDTMMRGAARASLFIGQRVGSDLVNIADFGGLPGRHGSLFFSDDGVLAEEPVMLVRQGILQPTMMTDLYSYTLMRDRLPGLRLSANGRLERYDHPVYARMTNTYFLPLSREAGGLTRDELIADTDQGVMMEQMTSGMEDPLGWGIQLQALRGREIKSGKLTGRLFYQVGLTGFVPDVLKSVDGLTTDLEVKSGGYCGKGHKEYVRVSTGGPYVRCRMKLG
jgi:TldD protein